MSQNVLMPVFDINKVVVGCINIGNVGYIGKYGDHDEQINIKLVSGDDFYSYQTFDDFVHQLTSLRTITSVEFGIG